MPKLLKRLQWRVPASGRLGRTALSLQQERHLASGWIQGVGWCLSLVDGNRCRGCR